MGQKKNILISFHDLRIQNEYFLNSLCYLGQFESESIRKDFEFKYNNI